MPATLNVTCYCYAIAYGTNDSAALATLALAEGGRSVKRSGRKQSSKASKRTVASECQNECRR